MADVTVGGLRLHVQRLGTGDSGRPPVIFLHGLVMDNLASWFFTTAPAVAATEPVVLYDLRGHGRSERPPSAYAVQDFVAELAGLMDAEGIGRARLVGHSFGGTLALAFALTHPERTAGLVLLDALVPEDGWGERMAATLTLDADARNGVIAERFADWLGRHSDRKRTKLERNARALVEGTSLVADLRASRSWSPAEIARLGGPVCLLAGAESDVRPQTERLASLVPDAEVAWLDGTHSLMWERPDAVKAQLVAWLCGGTA